MPTMVVTLEVSQLEMSALKFFKPSKRELMCHKRGWWAKMLVTGTFDGEPFTPMPDKLPALEKTGKAWEIGPEVFTVYTDESGEKITRITIEAQSKGALVGPPGIYVACGGKLG